LVGLTGWKVPIVRSKSSCKHLSDMHLNWLPKCEICGGGFRGRGRDKTCSKPCSNALRSSRARKIYHAKRDKYRSYYRNLRKSQRSTPEGRLLKRLRQHLNNLCRRGVITKKSKTLELLGCEIKDFRAHIESLFTPGMGWSNFGLWHLDHIKPCSSFNLHDEAQQRACFHFSNLQPLWAADNLRKSNKIVCREHRNV
jgi:hypothetical protein